jgi:VanZ family protein
LNPVRFAPSWLRAVAVLAWMGLIFWLSSMHKLPKTVDGIGDLQNVLGHFGAYGILAALVFWALVPHLRSSRTLALVTMLVVLAYGSSDEYHQSFVPGRTPDVKDILVDMTGAACMLVVLNWVARHGVPLAHRSARESMRSATSRDGIQDVCQ